MDTRDEFIPAIDHWATRHTRTFNLLVKPGPDGGLAKIRTAGLAKTCKWVVQQIRGSLCIFLSKRWDRKHRVDTSGKIPVTSLEVRGPNRDLAHHAVSTPVRVFDYLSRFFPSARSNYALIDLGCGKGRTLLLASRMEFGRVIGVEFAPQLCAVARQNLDSWLTRGESAAPCSVVEADATLYDLPREKLVLYFGNPFHAALWPAMIARLVKSYQEDPRNIRIVLAGSALPETLRQTAAQITATGIFQRVASGTTPWFIDSYLPYHYEILETYLV